MAIVPEAEVLAEALSGDFHHEAVLGRTSIAAVNSSILSYANGRNDRRGPRRTAASFFAVALLSGSFPHSDRDSRTVRGSLSSQCHRTLEKKFSSTTEGIESTDWEETPRSERTTNHTNLTNKKPLVRFVRFVRFVVAPSHAFRRLLGSTRGFS